MTKKELIEFIKYQLNIELKIIDRFSSNELIYVEIDKKDQVSVLSLLNKLSIEHNEHLNNKYWIYVKGD